MTQIPSISKLSHALFQLRSPNNSSDQMCIGLRTLHTVVQDSPRFSSETEILNSCVLRSWRMEGLNELQGGWLRDPTTGGLNLTLGLQVSALSLQREWS